MTPPESLQLRLPACPILVYRCRASFVPSPSECSTLPACCFQWVSIRHRLARPSLIVEWREITSPHSGGKRPCSFVRFARKSHIHAQAPARASSEQACPKSPERQRLTYPA